MGAALAILTVTFQHTGPLSIDFDFVIHQLPLWFLVFALFLPRIAMLLAWFQGTLIPFHLQGLVPALFWLLLPRVLVLYLIYIDQGIHLWFIIHLVVALLVWGGSGNYHSRRRRRDDY